MYERELFGHQRFLAQIDIGGLPYAKVAAAIELFAGEIAPVIRREIAVSQRHSERHICLIAAKCRSGQSRRNETRRVSFRRCGRYCADRRSPDAPWRLPDRARSSARNCSHSVAITRASSAFSAAA